MRFNVTYSDTIDADTEDEAYDHLLAYLKECVDNGDVMAFDFDEIHTEEPHKKNCPASDNFSCHCDELPEEVKQ